MSSSSDSSSTHLFREFEAEAVAVETAGCLGCTETAGEEAAPDALEGADLETEGVGDGVGTGPEIGCCGAAATKESPFSDNQERKLNTMALTSGFLPLADGNDDWNRIQLSASMSSVESKEANQNSVLLDEDVTALFITETMYSTICLFPEWDSTERGSESGLANIFTTAATSNPCFWKGVSGGGGAERDAADFALVKGTGEGVTRGGSEPTGGPGAALAAGAAAAA